MAKFTAILSLLLLAAICCSAQYNFSFRRIFALPGNAVFATADALHQIYLVDTEGRIAKFDSAGQLLFRQSNNRLGAVGFIDVTNPMNPLVFYPDYQEVHLLDRTLSPSGKFSLLSAGLLNVAAIGLSSDNLLWVFDPVNFQLRKLDFEGREVFATGNLNLLLGQPIQPNFLIERNQAVYLNDPERGVFVFDIFGKYLRTIPLKGLSQFSFFKDQLLYVAEGRAKILDWRIGTGQSYPLPPDGLPADRIFIYPNRLFILKGEIVEVWGW